MPCYYPLDAWRSKHVTESGKRGITFNIKERVGYQGDNLKLPCGQCIGCRLERSRQWAVRCIHEASLYEDNCFITLTYNNEHLPEDLSLDKSHYQKFMKRLRKRFAPRKIRFFHCGEYGEKNFRPHYHACLFNFDFPDKVFWSERDGIKLYTSPILQELWPYGFVTIGEVTFDSAAYVARYIMKKVTGDKAREHYTRHVVDERTGELREYEVLPEYTTMSRKPGIGSDWFDKWKDDVYPEDFVVVNGKKVKPPKFYDTRLEMEDAEALDYLKFSRLENAIKFAEDNTTERLRVKETVKKAQVGMLHRPLDGD